MNTPLPSHDIFILFQIAAAFFFFLVEMFKSYLILKVREMVLVGNSVCTGSGALGSMTRGPEQHPQAVPRAVQDPNPASSSA